LGIDKNFVIYDLDDQVSLIRRILKDLKLSDNKQLKPKSIQSIISGEKNKGNGPDEYEAVAYYPNQKSIAKVFYKYEEEKKKAGALDFDDLLLYELELFKKHPEVREKWQKRFKHILIDEYQDTNTIQYQLVKLLVNEKRNICVVGDDWQAINRFAGSEVEYFKEFEKFFPDGVRRCEITTNYRCDREVVEKARKFMAKAMGEKGEFRAFSRRMGKVMVVDPRVTECELPLVKYDRRVSGRDAVYAEMARRMLGREPKRKTVRYVKTVVELMRVNRKAQEIMLLHRNNEMNLEWMSLVRLTRGLKWGLERMGVMSEEEFDAKVRVMTMHKSKGLEAEVVIILEADEGVIPKLHPDTLLYGMFGETLDVALDDQKRLFYVAMTRAKRRLYIIHDGSSGAGFVKYLGRGVERWGE
jgi:superfamily I DNA/RNA helicase